MPSWEYDEYTDEAPEADRRKLYHILYNMLVVKRLESGMRKVLPMVGLVSDLTYRGVRL